MGKIKINGKEQGATLTGGALLQFKRKTGYDFIREPEKLDTEGLITLAWASAKSHAALDGEKFTMTVEDFADRMSLQEVNALGAWLQEEMTVEDSEGAETADDGEKKSGGA